MSNPFDLLMEKLNELDIKLSKIPQTITSTTSEIIGRAELCKRLNITEPTCIRWEKKKLIPSFRIGSSVRYNWVKVIESLEKKK